METALAGLLSAGSYSASLGFCLCNKLPIDNGAAGAAKRLRSKVNSEGLKRKRGDQEGKNRNH